MRSIISILFAISFSNLMAQSITNNPLSYFGIGEQNFGSNAIYDALGRNSINYFDSSQLNIFNPASYSSMSSGNTLLTIGLNGRLSKFSELNNDALRIAIMPDQFALGFKLSKQIGAAFGLKPYTRRGYDITEYDSINLLINKYEGSGGTQAFFLGAGFRIFKLKRSNLSLGFNANYIFGSVTNSRNAKLFSTSNSTPAGISNSTIKLNAINIDLGISFEQMISKNHSVILTGAFTPNLLSQNLKVSEGLFYANSSSAGVIYDTINYSVNSSSINNSAIKFGFSYRINLKSWKRNMRFINPSILFLGSYSTMKTNFLNSRNEMNQISFGIQFAPETKIFENNINLKLLEKINYRIGFYKQENSINALSNLNYNDIGFTLGLGIPITIQQSLSSFNASFSFGNCSAKNSNSLSEKYFGINFGFIFSPAKFDRWFRKRKLD
jgi:hypothetical protein